MTMKKDDRRYRKAASAREAALHLILSVNLHGAYANLAVADFVRETKLTDIDRRFTTELVYGTIKAKLSLAWVLKRHLPRPDKLAPIVQAILLLGAYQLLYLEKVPVSAACNESVALAKKYAHAAAARLVNAVLRKVAAEKATLPWPDVNTAADPAEALSIVTSHPVWLTRRWIAQLGLAEAEQLCRLDNAAPPLSFRVNTNTISREAALAALSDRYGTFLPSAIVPDGIVCRELSGSLNALPLLQDGVLQIQDEASMLVGHIVAPQPGERVLDVCSAPGGKTTHLAALMKGTGEVVALDIHPHKVQLVKDNAQRQGLANVRAQAMDARELPSAWERSFDRVLVDAPCSGLGVLRRKADARWNKMEAELAALPALQLAILRRASQMVKPGGRLVYSTCTTEPGENQAVVEAFLAEHPAFALVALTHPLHREKTAPWLQLWPQRDGTDGFFIACLTNGGE